MNNWVARSEIARIIIDLFNTWNAEVYDQNKMNDLINEACVQILRDPKAVVANAKFAQIMSALYYSYNMLYSISSSIPNEDLDGYGVWCSQVERWMAENVGNDSGISGATEQVGTDGENI